MRIDWGGGHHRFCVYSLLNSGYVDNGTWVFCQYGVTLYLDSASCFAVAGGVDIHLGTSQTKRFALNWPFFNRSSVQNSKSSNKIIFLDTHKHAFNERKQVY